jgi:diguanylate cyclase (GGDEF)-like protein
MRSELAGSRNPSFLDGKPTMNPLKSRQRIESEILARVERKFSEEELANHLMSLLIDGFPLRSASILALKPGGKGVSVFAHRGLSGRFIKEMYARPIPPVVEAGLGGEILVAGDDSRSADPAFRLEHASKSLFAVPCRMGEETLGVFIADSGDPDLFTPEVRESFRSYARIGTLFLALRDLRGRVSRVPDTDDVTGLFSFKPFHEVLHRELMRGRKFRHPVSLVFIKIRNLREMNGTYGHVAADNALAEVAGRVRAALREVDSIARSGSGIYVVMPQIGKDGAAAYAEKLAETMESSPIGKGDVVLHLAMGVCSYPKDGDTERVLIPHVESMVHESMRKGGNAVSVYKD